MVAPDTKRHFQSEPRNTTGAGNQSAVAEVTSGLGWVLLAIHARETSEVTVERSGRGGPLRARTRQKDYEK